MTSEYIKLPLSGGGAVDSVNGQTGAVVLDAADVGAQPTGDYITALTGDVTASGPGSATATIAGTAAANIATGLINNTNLQVLQGMGSDIKGSVGIISFPTYTNYTLSDGQIIFSAMWLPVSATITGAMIYMSTQGNFTGDNTNAIGLYTLNNTNGDLTKVAETANDQTIWKTTLNTFKKVPFTSTYVATAGLYYVALLHNMSATVTAPRLPIVDILSHANVSAFNLSFARIAATKSGEATLAASYNFNTGMTSTTNLPWTGVY